MIDGVTIAIISRDELELRNGSDNIICSYSEQDNKLRAVVNVLGTTKAKYFDITPEGLVDEDGNIYYEPKTYQKVMAQRELNAQLIDAVESDDANAIADLLLKGASVDSCDERGTAIAIAVTINAPNAVQVLLQNKADPNTKLGMEGNALIRKAVENGRIPFLWLIRKPQLVLNGQCSQAFSSDQPCRMSARAT